MAQKKYTRKFGTKAVRLSYAYLAKPKEGTDKYTCALLIPKSDKETINRLKEAYKEVYENNQQMLGDYDLKAMIRLYDGNGASPTGKKYQEAYHGFMVLNASNTMRPKYLSQDGEEIIDVAQELYSGVWAKVGITLFPYSNSGNTGIGVSLDIVKKVKDDEPLGGVVSESDYFGDDDDDDLLKF